MRFKNKGRKIYKTKEKNYYGKSPLGKAFSIGLSILLVGGIGFIGYSVAEPLVTYTKKKGDSGSAVVSETNSPAEATTYFEALTDNGGEDAPVHHKANFETYRSAAVKPTDLASAEALQLAIKRLPTGQNFEYLEVPMKTRGGRIYYASEVYYAKASQAYQQALAPERIAEIVREAGYKPVAIVSAFNDNLLPVIDGSTGYVTADTGEQWIDDDYEAGGKPWTTPYSQTANRYLGDVVGEIASAGFDKVVCSDFTFPHFRASDLEILDKELSGSGRTIAMTAAANQLNDIILNNGSTMFIEVSAAELLAGYKDVLQPMLLNVNTIVLDIDFDEISSGVYAPSTVYQFSGKPADRAEKMIGLVENDLSDFNVVVRLSGNSASVPELIEARDRLAEKGYGSFVIG